MTRSPASRLDRAASRLSGLEVARDYEVIYRHMALYEFPWDTVTALNLAFYRTFTSPRMAALLAHTGEMEKAPKKRSQDTGLFVYDLIASGLDSARGREAIQRINLMHRRWPIEDEDHQYVLAAFITVPIRWLHDYGWRELLPAEVEAATRFYLRLGDLMGIKGMPTSFDEVAAMFDAYERKHLAYSDEASRLLRATQGVLADRLPKPLRFLARPLLRVLVGPRLAPVLGLRPPSRPLRITFRLALVARSQLLRRRSPRAESWFTPGRRTSVYPDGYALDDLGVHAP